MGARTLREYAWSDYGLTWSFDEADAIRNSFFDLYPAIRPYQLEQNRRAKRDGVLYSVAGRPRRAIWEPDGEIWFTDCCNYAVQSSAADVLLDAMARIDRVLPGTLVASLHDELLLLVEEDQAERAAEVLVEQMTAAFIRWFPNEPTTGLVSAKICRSWDEAK
jgi:DNA polymerase I-like protein with 3'-5' exonuclease and polymerase domains